MSRTESAPQPAVEVVARPERPLWPAGVIVAGVVASILWVVLLGWWVAIAVWGMI